MLKVQERKRVKTSPLGDGPKQTRHPRQKPKRIQTAESWIRQVRAEHRGNR